MSDKLFKINDKISVQCEYYENSRHWGHRAKLYFYDRYIGKTTITYYNRTWERFQFQSVLEKIADKPELTKEERQLIKEYADKYDTRQDDNILKTTALVASLGEIFGGNQKEKNDWKERMIRAGLGDRGLIMPEDWDTLTEDEKTKRLDGAIKILVK